MKVSHWNKYTSRTKQDNNAKMFNSSIARHICVMSEGRVNLVSEVVGFGWYHP